MSRLFLLLCVFLVACAPRAQLIATPESLIDVATRSVFVGTTRLPEAGRFGAERAEGLHYLRFDIATPPERPVGRVTWPWRSVDTSRDFTVAGVFPRADRFGFRSELKSSFRALPPSERDAVVYVHGFNNTFAEGILRITQLAEDFKVDGLTLHYSWPSAGNPLNYVYDRDSILVARDGLDSLIDDIKSAGADNIILVAHSAGSMLVMETLRQRAIANPGSVAKDIGGVVLISPDIDGDVFEAQARRIGTLPQPFGIFVSRKDYYLTLSAALTGKQERLGNTSDQAELAQYGVSVVDITDFASGSGHFTAMSSPALISIFSRAPDLEAAFQGRRLVRAASGQAITVQNTRPVSRAAVSPGPF